MRKTRAIIDDMLVHIETSISGKDATKKLFNGKRLCQIPVKP